MSKTNAERSTRRIKRQLMQFASRVCHFGKGVVCQQSFHCEGVINHKPLSYGGAGVADSSFSVSLLISALKHQIVKTCNWKCVWQQDALHAVKDFKDVVMHGPVNKKCNPKGKPSIPSIPHSPALFKGILCCDSFVTDEISNRYL